MWSWIWLIGSFICMLIGHGLARPEDKHFKYSLFTTIMSFLWPIAIPVALIYLVVTWVFRKPSK